MEDVLPLLRAYCDFYGRSPSDEALRGLCEALVADPVNEGVQLVARAEADPPGRGPAIGFATVYWTWQTTGAQRIGVMNDLFVAEHARGSGVADALLLACADAARERGCGELSWVTAPDNRRAQRVYDRTAARRSTWLRYGLPL